MFEELPKTTVLRQLDYTGYTHYISPHWYYISLCWCYISDVRTMMTVRSPHFLSTKPTRGLHFLQVGYKGMDSARVYGGSIVN